MKRRYFQWRWYVRRYRPSKSGALSLNESFHWRRNACAIRVRFTHTYLCLRPRACTHPHHRVRWTWQVLVCSTTITLDRENNPENERFKRRLIDRDSSLCRKSYSSDPSRFWNTRGYCESKYEFAGGRGEPYRSFFAIVLIDVVQTRQQYREKSCASTPMPFNCIARQEAQVFSH